MKEITIRFYIIKKSTFENGNLICRHFSIKQYEYSFFSYFNFNSNKKKQFRLDDTLVQHCIKAKAKSKTPCISATHSSSQSSSLAGEQVDVKVEITPPKDGEVCNIPNSVSVDSTATMNLSINLSDYKTPTTSPQQRKLSELPAEGLLNPANFGRFTPTPSSASSSKLYKKFEELIDLSSPYNHYRCLSPSESNLTTCNEGKYIYGIGKHDNKPGSSRLLRRQFSLDRDDCHTAATSKSNLDVPIQESLRSSPSPTNIKPGRLHKQTSTSVAQDLEKIEEIPISPTSGLCNHKSDITLSQIPGSGTGSPASKNEEETNFDAGVISSNNTRNNLNNNNNSNREISLNVESLMLR